MKNTLAILLVAVAIAAPAQTNIQPVDLTTVTTNYTSSSAVITIPGVTTNAPYTVTNNHSLVIGDPLPTAFAKINGNFVFVESQISSNQTGPISGTRIYSLPTNAFSISTWLWLNSLGGTANAIPNYNGSGTNLNLFGTTTLNGSNLRVYETTIGLTNTPLVPVMTGSNLPSGLATASCFFAAGFDASKAFTNGTGGGAPYWASCAGSNAWVQYQFPVPVIATNFTGVLSGISTNGAVSFQSSTDGTNWITVASWIGNTAPQTNAFPQTIASWWRWQFSDPGHTDVFIAQNLQLWGYQQVTEIIQSQNPLTIIATNGLKVIGNVDSSVGFTVNGQPLQTASSPGSAGTIYSQLWVTNGTGTATNYNGLFTIVGAGYFTNANGWYLLMPGTWFPSPTASPRFVLGVYVLSTNITAPFSLQTPIYTNGFLLGSYAAATAGTPTNMPVISAVPSTSGGGSSVNNYYVASNAVVSSQTYTSLATNFNATGSNYLGRFTNVISFSGMGPQFTVAGTGPLPGGVTITPLNFFFSTNGSTWATNLPAAPNLVYAAVTCTATGLSSVLITSATHPEVYGHTNDLTQQITWVAEPVGPVDAVTKGYCDNVIASRMANSWNSDGTNYFYGGVKIAVPVNFYNAISTPVIDGSGTNYAISIIVTNFIPGWVFQVQTNLALPFYTPTSYSLTTNSGVATFAVPMTAMPGMAGFFRVVSPQPGSIRLDNGPLINVTTNQIIWGATNTAPANTSTPVGWISVQVSGRTNAYRMPIYQ